LKPDIGDFRALDEGRRSALLQEIGWRAIQRGMIDAIRAADDDAWFKVVFNGVSLQLPAYTIKTMQHCLAPSVNSELKILVETAHWNAMRAELQPGTLFIDVGAATGAMTIPFAMTVPGIRVIAFEPSRQARVVLQNTLAKNGISGATVLPYAISDSDGTFQFMEYPQDVTGNVPFLPEASRLKTGPAEQIAGTTSYEVPTRTLDGLVKELALADARKMVVKIDVEGFETHVLRGASHVLELKPYLFIDIHAKPGAASQETTEAEVREILKGFGYRPKTMAHVLIAEPNHPL
jgi:FkbM family methyltransferase